MWLPLVSDAVSLFDEFAGNPVAVAASDGGVVVPAGSRLYLKSKLSRAELTAAFSVAKLLDRK